MPTHNRLDKIAFGAGRKRKEENYWLNRLSGELERCCFNDDHKKTNEDESNEPKHRSIRQLEFNINGDLYLKLIKLSAGSLPRLHMILTTGLIILINRYTGIEDVIIGAPIYKQEIETEFVNTILVLRNRLTPRMSFKELLLQVRQTLNETVENQNYPIEMILDKLKIPYNIAEDFPLFDIAVLLENLHEAKYLQHIHLNMIFSFKKTPESIAGKIEYNESSYEKTTIEQIITHFNLLLSRALLDLDQTINQFELFTEEEKIKLLSFCNTQVDFPENKTIYHFFEDQVKKNPDHISIFGLSLLEEAYLQISYRELNEKSNRLALWLEQGNVGPDTIVGVLLNRSVEMITAIFGIEKAGAAYLPIDPNYPPGRIDYMLKDSNAKIVLTADELRDCSRNALHYPGHNEFGSYDHRSSSSLAYVIYTSGTTGKPKGAGIENRSLVNRLHWMQKKYRLDSRDIILHKTPFTFDVSVWEIFWWSMAGASVCLLKPGSEKDPAMIIQTIEKYGVTVMHFVPSMLSVFLDYIKNNVNVKKLAGLKQVIASGEALPISLVNLFNRLLYIENGTRLSNLYGPTEATIDVTCFDCSTGETLKRIPIGKPIDNITLYILGKNLHLQPLGAAGELCIGGVGLGRGYLNRSELTAEKFIAFHHSSFDIPHIHHLKLYRTGDLARWLPDGNIEYLGRIDFQVKIRGFRIELGEIENQLALHKGIKEAVVIARENANNDKYLCAYVVLDNMYSFVHLEEDLHEYLSKDLPNFMVPQHFVVLERIPLTANGKIDRRALPEPGSHQSRQYVEPVTDTQKKLVQIWSEVLGLEKIGINENYFRIGGDSITAIKLASFINKRMNTHMMVMDLYSNETIEKLAFIIEQSQLQGSNEELALAQQEVEELKNRIIAENALTPMDPNIEDIFPMCDIEKGMTFYTLTDSDVAMYHDQFIYQIKYANFDILRLKKALTLLVAKHEMLRTAFNLGDYEEPVHILYKNIQIDFMDFDISKMEKLSQEMYIRNFIEEDRRIPFNIMKAPLWRIRTFILNQNYICVLWIFHHAILDGWSVASLMTELNNTYLELKATPHYFPQKLNSTYKHFVIEQIVEKKKDDVRNYWQGELEDYKRLDFSGLKNDNDTPAIKRVRHKYGNAMLQKLSGTAEIYNTSVKHLCLGAYIYMLNMISYEDDIVVGLVTNNRPIREDSEKMLGCFLNTIPIRFKVPDSATYIEYIRLIDAKIVELKKYERLSLFEILRTIGEISQNKNPIFDTIFSFIDFHVYELLELDNKETSGDGDGLSLEGYERTNTLFDFIVSTTGGVFNISMAYANTLISNHSAARLLRYFENILEKMSKEPDRLMDKNEIIPLEEKEQILANFNDTTDEFPLSKGIHQLFAAQAGRTPDNVAVIGSSIIRPNEKPSLKIQLTYHELDEMSVHLATWLNYQGMKTGNIIGIMMERSPEIIIGVMGILKGGCAYLPIDANYPQERIDYMLKDSNAKMLVSTSIFQDVMKNYTGINRYDLPGTGDSLTFQSANPAYVIYTSGSTGNPKGVVIEHNSIVNYIHWAARHYVKYDEIHFPLFTSMSFDLTLTSIFVPLITGNKIIVYNDDDIWDIIREIVDDNHAGAVKLTPSHLQILRVKDIPVSGSHIKRLILGGEMLDTPLTQEIYRHFNKKVEIYNEYGPTEATVGCMIYQFNEQTDINPYIPIGKPAANCQIYLLDKNKKIVPPGGLGEIYIGGAGIARGYLNRIELTAEKFIHLSMDQKNVTLYKTGDLARWRPDWNLDFLGRSDQQVKVRGYRIELGEIENALLKHKGVKEAVVIAMNTEGDNDYLIAYIVPVKANSFDGSRSIAGDLKKYLSQTLAAYMIPTHFIKLDRIPLTINGKINKKALPLPEIEIDVNYIAPRKLSEEKLVEIWSEILKIDRDKISIDHNYFELGGHSLNAVTLINRIHKELHKKISMSEVFNLRTVRNLSIAIEKGGRDVFSPIKPVEKKEYYPCTSAEERLYFLQIAANTTNYNMPLIFIVAGNIDLKRIEDVFKIMIERHHIYRTGFEMVHDNLVQRIFAPGQVPFKLEYYEAEEKNARPIVENFIRLFDLSQPPLMRAGLIKVGESKYIMMMDTHHIIGDGISTTIFLEDFSTAYLGGDLPALNYQYEDYTEWQNSLEQKLEIKKQEEFWMKTLGGELPRLNLPLDFPRSSIQAMEGKVIFFDMNDREIDFLRKLALKEKTTPFSAIFAIYNIFLGALSGQEDILIGTFLGKRRHPDLQRIIGMFVGTLVFRNYPQGEKTFIDFLGEVKDRTLAAFENQEYEFDDLVKKLDVKKDLSRTPLFDAMFSFINADRSNNPLADAQVSDIKLSPFHDYKHDATKFDIGIFCFDDGKNIRFSLEYCTNLFKDETINKFISYFKKIVLSIMENPGLKISEIEIISEEEKKQILFAFNDTEVEYPGDKTIHELFADQMQKTPGNIALIGPAHNLQISYLELNEKSNQMAHLLRAKGVTPGIIVGIMAERSIEMLLGIFAILKAGGSYLPIDTNYHSKRIDFILADAGAKILLTQQLFFARTTTRCEKIFLDDPMLVAGNKENAANINKPGDLIYSIYTSGSTGKPKGVMVEHFSVVNILLYLYKEYPLNERDVYLFKTSYVFDVSVSEIFGWFLGGGRLAILKNGDEKDIRQIMDVIRTHRITHINFVPSMFNAFADGLDKKNISDIAGLKYIFLAGEALKATIIRKFNTLESKIRLENIYGPTEGTIYASKYSLPDGQIGESIPIGRPVNNVRLYILNKYGRMLPTGISGELFLSGVCLARGYLNRPELTAEKFINFHHSKLYCTGDLARWLPDGNIEFLGRIDQQVKIRGFRIELGEIESRLLNHNEIKEAVVTAQEDVNENKYLCAYIVSEKKFTITELRSYLSQYIPDYMLPSYLIPLKKIPLTPSGKVDLNAIPGPSAVSFSRGTVFMPPRNLIEKTLVEVWQNVLGANSVSIDDNFFEIGGDSIKAIQIVSRMKRNGYKVEMQDILRNPRISDLSPSVKKIKRIPDQSIVKGIIPLTPIQEWFFKNKSQAKHPFNQSVMLYAAEGFDEKAIATIFKKILEHHDALRMNFIEENGEIIQVNREECPLSLSVYDLRNSENAREALETITNEIYTTVDFRTGSLLKLGLFKLVDGDRLLIVIHHLIIDGISWRILFEDIETLYHQYIKGESPALPLKTDSFKLWAEKIKEYAAGDAFLIEKPYWRELELKPVQGIKKDFEDGENFIKDSKSYSFALNEAETNLLLTRVNEAFGTEINDILLTALGLAVKAVFKNDLLLLSLEGHGREEILAEVDVNRTVGWFTSLFPVVLDFSRIPGTGVNDENGYGRQIKEIKENLRRIPQKGIGYGILRYLTPGEYKNEIEFRLKPTIVFNYLGQFDEDIKFRSFKIAPESAGNSSGKNIAEQRDFELEITGKIAGKKLVMSIAYSRMQYKEETIRVLFEHYKKELNHIINYCTNRSTRELTPSDLTWPHIAIDVFEHLQSQHAYAIEDIYTLSPMQENMLFYSLYEDRDRPVYFEQISYRMQGVLNIPIMEKSLQDLFKRHDILRTVFFYEGLNRPLQAILKNRTVEFNFEDLRGAVAAPGDKDKLVREFRIKDRQRFFNLAKDVLMRVTVMQLADEEYQVTWSFHHILMDGWCIGILTSEFSEIYICNQENRIPQLPAVKSYKNYIQWLEKQDKNKTRNYWRKYLEGYDEMTTVPRKKNVGAVKEGNLFSALGVQYDKVKTSALQDIAGRNYVTVNTLIQTVWALALCKYNSTQDVVYGMLVSGRPPEIEGVETMIGCFINTIPIRITVDEKTSFKDLIQHVQERAIGSEPHHYFSLAEIQAESPLKQRLLDHIIEFQNYPVGEQIEGMGNKMGNKSEKPGKQTTALEVSNVESFEQGNYDFYVMVYPRDQIYLSLSYNVELYDRELVEQLGLNCLRILDQAIENDSLTIGDIAFLTDEEKRKILFEFNDTRMDFPRDKTIYRFVEDHAEMTPHHIAVTGMPHNGKWGIELTYRVLNERANRMARKLRNTCIGTDDLVGILMDRSLIMMISILAIWKAGGAYIPLDPKNPPQRILEILNDSGSKVLIAAENGALSHVKKEYRGLIINTTASDDHELTHESPVDISNRTAKFDMNGLAYVIYTSGSTGKPKGAMIEHIGMMNHIHAKVNELQLTAKSVVLQNAAHTFDISVWQFFSAMVPAGKTIIYPEEVILDPGKFISRIAGDQITILEVVPSYLAALMEYLWEGHTLPLALQYLLVTGEEVKPHLIRKWFERYPGIPMVNAYGPTEASDDITHYFMDKDPGIDHIPIGKPLQNLNIYITDNNMNLCPIGVKGEICVSGVGVGRGYLGDEEKTRHVFMEDPFINEKGVRLYKTGDIGLWLPDGNIQFFGRKDYQVKIRGFRIELGEIEKKLLSHPQIKETVVTDKEDKYGNKYLCAYIVPHADNLPGITELKRYLADSLPEYMIPAHFEILKKIPLSSSGKVDRKALPIPDEIEIAQKYTAPTNHIEEKLVEIWAEVLDKEKSVIGTEHSFFDLGGHSLRAIVLVSKIHKEFDVKIPLVELFRTPVIKQLSLYIEKAAKDRFASIETIEKKEYYALSSAQKRLYILQQMDPASTAYNMPEVIPLMVTPDLEKFKNTFIRLITRHESLRTSFHLVNDEPVQRIQDGVEFEIGYYELNADDRERMKVVNIFDRAFDLTEAPLLKAGVVKTVAAQYFLVVVMHHIISDGISHQVLANDFMALFSDDRDEALTPLRIQYKDFSHWQNSPQERNRIKNQEVYWLKEFAGEIPLLKLPTDFPRPHVQLFKGSSLHGSIPIDTEKFKTLAFENDVTSFMVFLAIFNIFLYKMSGQEDIVIGTPVSGRRHADLEKIIGMFVNSLPLRNQPHGEMSFAGFLKDVRRNTLAAFENQEYQFEDLVEKLPVKRDRHNPIFDVMFTCREKKFDARDEDEVKEEIAAASLKQNAYNYVEFRTSKFDFTLNIVIAKKLLFSFEYSSELFKRETIEMFADGFKEIVSAIMADTNIKLKDINITTFLADTDSSAVQEELTGMDF